MARAYSMGLRKRVIEACNEGQTIALVGERFRVSASLVNKLQQRRREWGTLEPKTPRGSPTLVVSRA
jgi:transposase